MTMTMPKTKLFATKAFATTVTYYQNDPRFTAKAEFIDVPEILESGGFHPRAELQLLLRVLKAARHHQYLLLFSHRGAMTPELVAVALLSFLPSRWRPQVVFHGEMYEPDQSWRSSCARRLIRLADRIIVRYVVYSRAEMATFSRAWGISRAKMRYALHPFYGNRKLRESAFIRPATAPHIFAGGNSFRDYGPLIAAAGQMPEEHFVICTTELAQHADLPANVHAGAVSRQDFVKLMEESAIVVVPIQRDTQRIAGALTFLEGLWLNKPTVVADGLGVREYVEDGRTGWVVDGSSEEYVRALRWIIDPANEAAVAAICARGHQQVDCQFSIAAHVTALLAIMAEVCGDLWENEES